MVTNVLEDLATLKRHGVMSQQDLNLQSKFCRNFGHLLLGLMRSYTMKTCSHVKCDIYMAMLKKILLSGMRWVVFGKFADMFFSLNVEAECPS